MASSPRSPARLAALLAGLLALGLVAWWLASRPGDAPSVEASAPAPAPRSPRDRPRTGGTPAPADLAASTPSPHPAPTPELSEGLVQEWKEFLTENAEDAEASVDRFCRAAGRAAEVPGLQPGPRRNDAAAYLATGLADTGAFHLPPALATSPGSATAAELARLDFGWMRELQRYDHWTLGPDGPLGDAAPTELLEAEGPRPVRSALLSWATLRLARGRADGDLSGAAGEVRHLGRLLASSGTPWGEVMAEAVAAQEEAAWAAAGQAPAAPLPPLDVRRRRMRTLLAGAYFLLPGVAPQVRDQALACLPSPCAAVTRALGLAAGLRGAFPEAAEAVPWLQARASCDPELALGLVRSPPFSEARARRLLEDQHGLEDTLPTLEAPEDRPPWP